MLHTQIIVFAIISAAGAKKSRPYGILVTKNTNFNIKIIIFACIFLKKAPAAGRNLIYTYILEDHPLIYIILYILDDHPLIYIYIY